ncbi:MAG: DUF429 domain-containing protein [Myxococcales bacterium]|nr:DUF429 domain-containing protein [Myxococcales bacterium]
MASAPEEGPDAGRDAADDAPPRARAFRRFLGINLGGGRGKTTAVARLEREPGSSERVRVVEARLRVGHRGGGEEGAAEEGRDALFRDDVLVAYVRRWLDDETVVAINAPLTLPPCIRCQLPCPGIEACEVPVVAWMRHHAPILLARSGRGDRRKPSVTPYTQRAVDVLHTQAGLQPRESLGQGMGPLAARAVYLRRALSPALRLHENLLEVHPPATLVRLCGAEFERSLRQGETARLWSRRKEALDRLDRWLRFDYVWPEIVVRSPHIFDAVISAFTAARWADEGWKGPADLVEEGPADPVSAAIDELGMAWLEDGWIWAPPTPGQSRSGNV